METLDIKTSESSVESDIRTNLTLPERAQIENEQIDLGKKLGEFLFRNNYIKDIEEKEEDEGFTFDYDSETKTIYTPKEIMPLNYWRDIIFRKQTELDDGTKYPLFPMHPMYSRELEKKEITTYLLLKTTAQIYNKHLILKESEKHDIDPSQYYDFVLEDKINSPLANLLRICYEKRKKTGVEKASRGLTTFGSLEEYNFEENEDIQNEEEEYKIRALEDAKELITMNIWNHKFFESYIDYLSSNSKVNLYKKHIFKIKVEDAEKLKDIIFSYTEEMKEEIDYNKNT